MKKTMLAWVFLSFFSTGDANAQVKLGVNVNLGTPPAWGPAGYDRADYYYIPDLDMYYDVPGRRYIYKDKNRWVFVNQVPPQYRNYNFYNGYKVVINEPTPYLRDDHYRVAYVKYKNWKGPKQVVIRDKGDKHEKNGKDHKNKKGKHGDD